MGFMLSNAGAMMRVSLPDNRDIPASAAYDFFCSCCLRYFGIDVWCDVALQVVRCTSSADRSAMTLR